MMFDEKRKNKSRLGLGRKEEHPYLVAVEYLKIHPMLIVFAAVILTFIFLSWYVWATAEAASMAGVGSYV